MRTTLSQFFRDVEALSFPEYRARHIFTAKLRLMVFMGFWFFYVLALKNELQTVMGVTTTISISFLCTVLAYYLIIVRGRVVIAMALEIVADVVAITAIVYLTGGVFSDFFTLYVLYTLSAGAFYNYRLSLLVAVVSYVAYMAMTLALWQGWIGLLAISLAEGHHHEFGAHGDPWVHPLLLAVLLILAIYVAKIAHQFTQRRERMLEEKNRELAALHSMSNTVQSVASLSDVTGRVLSGMLSGLELSLCLLMLIDKKKNRFVCFPPTRHPLARKAEGILGFPLSRLSIPIARVEGSGTVRFHRSVRELVAGIEPAISAEQADRIQETLGLQNMVTLPLIAENEILGTCIGMTTAPLIEDHQLATLEVFANQAALLLQTTMLIEELKEKNRELVEANRAKSEFLATMSHELRTPLTAIIGFSELLLEGVMGELNAEQRDSQREVLNNGTSLLDLINNLLDFVKVESGMMGLHYQHFSMADMVDRLRRSLWPLIQRKQQDLQIVLPPDLPLIRADEKRIQQVMLNLFSNAIKFTPERGRIQVKVEYVTDAKPHFIISVTDSGIGIAKENLEKIFEMFKQVDSSVSRSYEGTGLGLALAKQLVDLHGGRIWVESELGHGAKFVCLIPNPSI